MRPRILVVDDEAPLLSTITANLDLEGFEAVGAAGPAEALAAAAGPPFDLVLSDFRMPGMNGLELMRAIRKIHSGVPFVLMTAFAAEGLLDDALAEGAFAILPKPFAIEELVALLGRALARPAVLVVDDSPELLEVLVLSLRKRGIWAEGARDAEEAVAITAKGHIDLCVIDMVMPGVSGPALIERLRRDRPELIILGISGHDSSVMVRQSGGHLTAFLRKPFTPSALAAAIGKARLRATGPAAGVRAVA